MTEQIIKDRGIEALKVAAGWPGAERATLVTLATVLAGTRADAEGFRYLARPGASPGPGRVLRRAGRAGHPSEPGEPG